MQSPDQIDGKCDRYNYRSEWEFCFLSDFSWRRQSKRMVSLCIQLASRCTQATMITNTGISVVFCWIPMAGGELFLIVMLFRRKSAVEWWSNYHFPIRIDCEFRTETEFRFTMCWDKTDVQHTFRCSHCAMLLRACVIPTTLCIPYIYLVI